MNFTQALRQAHYEILKNNPNAFILGLGISYPYGADGSTRDLFQEFPNQILEMPTSELAMTGAAVGMATQGLRPIVHYGRVEFAMLAFDQILTQAARWDFMFGGNYPCPLVLRICIGRGGGSGPQHTANYHSIFLQCPGLDVYIPTTPQDAYDALISSSRSNNPAVILEHRWLKNTQEEVIYNTSEYVTVPNGSIYGDGKDFLILTYAEGLVDSLIAMDFCNNNGIYGKIACFKYFNGSVRFSTQLQEIFDNTTNIILVDPAPFEFGLLSGVLSNLAAKNILKNVQNIKIICPQFKPCPSSDILANDYYPNPYKIINALREFGYELPEALHPNLNKLSTAPEINFTDYTIQLNF